MDLCYKTSNNRYPNFPPRMDDGRHFTDYRPKCFVDNVIKKNNKLLTSHQYKEFIMNNATRMMELNRIHACQKNCSSKCDDLFTVPYNMEISCNSRICAKKKVNKHGIGIKINYGKDELDDLGEANSYNVDLSPNCCKKN